MRRIGLAVTAVFMTASTLAGQATGIGKGTFEIGAFGRYNRPTTAYTVMNTTSNRWGGGGRIGLFVARNLAVELDASSNPFDVAPSAPLVSCTPPNSVSCPLLYTPIHLQLVDNVPASNRFFLLIGGGVSDQHLSKAIQNSTFGVGGTAGFRWRALRTLSFRLDGTLDIVPKGTFNVLNTYAGGQIGVDFLLGGHGCDHAADVITIRPTSANLQPGETETFSATASYCGGSADVAYRLTGSGTLDSLTGSYTATVPGTAQVVAYSRKGKLTSAANVTVTVPTPMAPPPPPAPRSLPPPPPPPPPLPTPPTPPPPPPPPPVTSVTSVAIVGPSRARAGVLNAYRAQPRLADGTPVTRGVIWSVISGTASVDGSGRLVTAGSGLVVIQAKSEDATATDSVTSYDWHPFGNGSTIGAALESSNHATNQFRQSGYPTLLIGCGSGTFVLGVVTQSFVSAAGAVSYSFDGGPITSDTWLKTSQGIHSFIYFRGSNAARKLFANRIAASKNFVFAFSEDSVGAHAAGFAVTGMTGAIAASMAACPSAGLREPMVGSTNSAPAINALLTAWRQATHH